MVLKKIILRFMLYKFRLKTSEESSDAKLLSFSISFVHSVYSIDQPVLAQVELVNPADTASVLSS